jgi:cbb3-type cytochrome oxidase subunit 1
MNGIKEKEDNKDIASLSIGILWLRIALSISQQFEFSSVHSHLSLLGWVTFALSGIIYCIFPKAGRCRLGWLHFWLFNVGLPVMSISLFFYMNGQSAIEPIVALGSLIFTAGVICFALNIFLNIGGKATLPPA